MASATGGFELTAPELRAVVRFALESATGLLPRFEAELPQDRRPRAALEAAASFADGAPRTNLQRTAAFEAHRAAKAASTEAARLAAQACGDAAAAAYLHPIARATQLGHILRAAACAARVAEIDGGAAALREAIEAARERATPILLDVLRRYPQAPVGGNRLAQLQGELDAALRQAARAPTTPGVEAG